MGNEEVVKIDRKSVIAGSLLGILLMAGYTQAESLWHQKVILEVTVPRKIIIIFSTTKLTFGAVEDMVTEILTITNQNGYAVTLYWTIFNVPEGLEVSVYDGTTEIVQDYTGITLSPGRTVTLSIIVKNVSAEAPTGTDVTYEFTMKFYYAG